MPRRATILLLVLLLCGPLARADDHEAFVKEHLNGLSGAAALELVKELAADAMKGRKTAFEGGALVENWMLNKMAEFGLHPADAGGTYLEPFTYAASNTVAPIALKIGGKALVYGTDYFDLSYSGSGKVQAEAVFVGYGIERPDLGWDDYAGIDVKGKVVMAIRGAPAARSGELAEERFIGYKSSKAAEKGAAGFLLVQAANASTGTIQNRFYRGALPALWVSGTVADAVFAAKKTTLAALKASRDKGSPGTGFATGVIVDMEVHSTYVPHAKGHNALGAIYGRDPDLTEEVILVGAHMDHLGVGPDGQVFNGADDNASGTAVLIHLADVLTANRLRPKRTIIFCGFGAEEQGLFGSKALAERYPFRGTVVAVLNMDMVGQGEPIVRVNGGGAFPEVQDVLAAALPSDLAKQVRFGLRAGPGSDHWPFYERGVPAFGISTQGKHPNYHTPKDDVANIDPACLEAAANVVGRLLLKLAMHPTPLRNPRAAASYVLREAPRFAWADLRAPTAGGARVLTTGHRRDGAWPAVPEARTLLRDGVGALVVNVVSGSPAEAAAGWKELEALAAADGSPYVLARRAADIGAAWGAGKVALLPRLACPWLPAAGGAAGATLAALGYRWVVPWSAKALAPPDAASAAALGVAAREHKLLLGMGGVSPEVAAALRAALGEQPLTRLAYPGGQGASAQDAHTLLMQEPMDAGFFDQPGAAISWLRSTSPDPLLAALDAWVAAQAEGWDLPASRPRKALRAVLGGRLVAWLARAER